MRERTPLTIAQAVHSVVNTRRAISSSLILRSNTSQRSRSGPFCYRGKAIDIRVAELQADGEVHQDRFELRRARRRFWTGSNAVYPGAALVRNKVSNGEAREQKIGRF